MFEHEKYVAAASLRDPELAAEEQAMSRVGLLFCCAVTLLAFFLALRVLPISRVVPAQLGQLDGLGSNRQRTIQMATPTAAANTPSMAPAAATPSAAPPAAPTASAAAGLVPVPSASASPAARPRPQASAPPRVSAAPRSSAAPGQVYTVQAGDTLYSIARRYHTSPETLAAANGLPSSDLVKIGQRLTIP